MTARNNRFWLVLVKKMQPTSTRPVFVSAEAVEMFGPIPGWLTWYEDLMRNGFYVWQPADAADDAEIFGIVG